MLGSIQMSSELHSVTLSTGDSVGEGGGGGGGVTIWAMLTLYTEIYSYRGWHSLFIRLCWLCTHTDGASVCPVRPTGQREPVAGLFKHLRLTFRATKYFDHFFPTQRECLPRSFLYRTSRLLRKSPIFIAFSTKSRQWSPIHIQLNKTTVNLIVAACDFRRITSIH